MNICTFKNKFFPVNSTTQTLNWSKFWGLRYPVRHANYWGFGVCYFVFNKPLFEDIQNLPQGGAETFLYPFPKGFLSTLFNTVEGHMVSQMTYLHIWPLYDKNWGLISYTSWLFQNIHKDHFIPIKKYENNQI